MVAYDRTRPDERSDAASQLCRQRVVSHPDRDGQKYGSASSLFGSVGMSQWRNSRRGSTRPTGNDVPAIITAGGHRFGSASTAPKSFRGPDAQLVLQRHE